MEKSKIILKIVSRNLEMEHAQPVVRLLDWILEGLHIINNSLYKHEPDFNYVNA